MCKIKTKSMQKQMAEPCIVDLIISDCSINDTNLLVEQRNYGRNNLVGKYSYRIDNPFGEQRKGNQRHVHIYVKDKQVYAVNVDGSGHDGCHNVLLPNDVADALRGLGFNVPMDNIVECWLNEQGDGRLMLLD